MRWVERGLFCLLFETEDHCWVVMGVEQARDLGLATNLSQGPSCNCDEGLQELLILSYLAKDRDPTLQFGDLLAWGRTAHIVSKERGVEAL